MKLSAKRGDVVLSNRQKLILKAIIETYVTDGIPVGSKALTDKPYLNFSSATLRYDMAALEELGFLEKTHTSSGRIPSNLGYRYYVENLVTRDDDIKQLFPIIDQLFTEFENNKEYAVKEAINLLSELTNYTSMVLGPNEAFARINKVDFIPLANHDAVILIVTDKGHVQNEKVNIPEHLSLTDFKKIISSLNDLLENQLVKDAKRILKNAYTEENIIEYMEYQERIIDTFLNAFKQMSEENIYLTGMGHMLVQPEFNDINQLKELMYMLDRKELVKLVGHTNKLSVRIGREGTYMPTDTCSIISVPYFVSEEDQGTIAIIGPTRMDYSKVIPLMEYVAKNIAKLYKK